LKIKLILILLSFLILPFPLVSKGLGILYLKKVDGKIGWFEKGNDNKDWSYVGEIKKGETKWNWGIKYYSRKIFWRV